MKKTFFAAAAATLLITACHLFDASEKQPSANPLVGTWAFDSVSFGKDSSNLPWEYALLGLAFIDSAKTHFQFTADSIITLTGDSIDNKVAYHFNDSTKQLIVLDSTQTVFTFSPLNDSTITLSKTDTVTMHLSKKRKH